MPSNELAHVGVLGMRWGRRKNSESSVSTSSDDYAKVSNIKKKKLHEMSNDEIKVLTARVKLENEYKALNPSKIASGKKTVNDLFTTSQQIVGLTTLAVTAYKSYPKIKKFVTDVLATRRALLAVP